MKSGRRIAMRTVFAAAAITIVAALGEARADGPFSVLEWRDGVTTSRGGHAVWVAIGSMDHEALLPGHESEVTTTNTPSHSAALGIKCRAPGGAIRDRFAPSPPTGGVTLDDHSDQPDAYTVVHPMYWILELAGKHREHWPLRVQVGDGEAAVRPKYAQRYLAEFEYRFNRRFDLPDIIPRLVYVALRTPPMPERLLKLRLV